MSARVCAVGEFTSKLAAVYLEHLASGSVEDVDSGTGKEEIQLLEAFRELQLPVSVNQGGKGWGRLRTQQPYSCSQSLRTRHTTSIPIQPIKSYLPPRDTDLLLQQNPLLPLSRGGNSVSSVLSCNRCSPNHPGRHVLTPTKVKGHHIPREKGACPSMGASMKCASPLPVFLGGSCNPTTWRRDVAMPLLQKAGITYYNPQVEEWYPELIEIEEQAKQAANMLFFVVDNQTRAVSSMVEIAYLAGSHRDLVLVVADFQRENPKVGEDSLPKREVEDLTRGRVFVRKLAEEGGSLLQSSVEEAIRSAITIIKSTQSIAEYSARHQPIRLRSSHSLGEELRLLRQVFTMYDSNRSGHLSIQEAELALRSLHLEGSIISHLAATESHDHLSSWQQHGILFDDFCTLYAELKYRKLLEVWGGWVVKTLSYLGASWRWLSTWLWPFSPPHLSSSSPPFRDVFLGGSCGSTSWRTDIIIPILRQYGVSYFNPQVHNWDARLVPIEQQAKEQCSVLLFVVSGDTLSVASMVEVAYYIGQGRKLVLLLNDISHNEDQEVEGMKLSHRARKDYNRGRAYLTNIANMSRIPVYTNITDAALSTVYMVRGYRVPPISALSLSGTSV